MAPSQVEVRPVKRPFVPVRLEAKKFVVVALPPVALVQARVVTVPLVPKRLVEVTLVAVTEAKFAFHRKEAVPRVRVAS